MHWGVHDAQLSWAAPRQVRAERRGSSQQTHSNATSYPWSLASPQHQGNVAAKRKCYFKKQLKKTHTKPPHTPWEKNDLLISHGTSVCLRQRFQTIGLQISRYNYSTSQTEKNIVGNSSNMISQA